MKFELTTYESLSSDDLEWLNQIPGMVKPDYQAMINRVRSGEWWLFRLPKPAQGLAVGCESAGKLFICHLRGIRLFDTINKADLLEAARYVGLSGMAADTTKRGVLKLLLNKGFRLTRTLPGPVYGVELLDVEG